MKVRPILLGSLIRGREWALPRFLEGIANLDSYGLRICYYFIVQGDMPKELLKFIGEMHAEFDQLPEPPIRLGRPWKYNQYTYMAYLRNMLLWDASASGLDLFTLDSDIVVNKDTLQMLVGRVEEEANIAAALVRNHPTAEAYNYLNAADQDAPSPRTYTREKDKEILDDGWMPCDATGACALISNQVISNRVMYRPHPQGEDCGFADSYREIYNLWPDHSNDMWINTKHKVTHQWTQIMDL